ncbi:DUF2953 domain-containing protein [Lachnospiraceae bacterium LCP25S3_G4]
MLHILLLILKIIGIIVALIIGVLLLVSFIVLFVPVRYRITGTYENSLDSLNLDIRFSWLLHFVKGYATYKNSCMDWQMQVAWKKFNVTDDVKNVEEKMTHSAEEYVEEVTLDDTLSNNGKHQKSKKHIEKLNEKEFEKKSTFVQDKADVPKDESLKKRKRSIRTIIATWYRMIVHFLKNIKYTFLKICANIKLLLERKETLVEFILDEIHVAAFRKVKLEVIRLAKYLKPKVFRVYGIIGFDDPCTTGQVLAALSMLYPFLGDNMRIQPEFERRILKGEFIMKGKVRMAFMVILGIRLFFNKNVRQVIKDAKNFEF